MLSRGKILVDLSLAKNPGLGTVTVHEDEPSFGAAEDANGTSFPDVEHCTVGEKVCRWLGFASHGHSFNVILANSHVLLVPISCSEHD